MNWNVGRIYLTGKQVGNLELESKQETLNWKAGREPGIGKQVGNLLLESR